MGTSGHMQAIRRRQAGGPEVLEYASIERNRSNRGVIEPFDIGT